MAMMDARVPVVFAEPLDGDAVLAELGAPGPADAWFEPGPAHAAGCACCVGHSPAAMALAGLFAARARGEVPWFKRVAVRLATAAAAGQVQDALRADPVVAARYRVTTGA